MPLSVRKQLINDIKSPLSIRTRAHLLRINRSSLFYRAKSVSTEKQRLHECIIDLYTKRPALGYRRIKALLESQYSIVVSKKTVQAAMKQLNIQGVVSKRNLSLNRSKEYRYPYLLKQFPPQHIGDAWAVDITYIKHKNGYFYVTCIIDIVSRMIVGYAISNMLDTHSSLIALEQALARYQAPKILNSDQGVQFTSKEWVSFLAEKGIKISMDGKGRWADNIFIERFWRSLKYEEVYLRSYESLDSARTCIIQFIEWYNGTRPHQSLGYKTPKNVYFDGIDESQHQLQTNNVQATCK
jgi:putative transposase